VYRGNQKAERHFGIYSLYVMFYPQLVAGPIERPQNILHQFYEKHKFDYTNMIIGLRCMLWGFFKKLVIADRLAIYVGDVYSNYAECSSLQIIIAVFFFTLQIYCDFSGYSDIAIGAARAMGFKLMTNFDRPLFSTSITEMWRKWHISLSSWISDYLYTPLSIYFRDYGKWGIMLSLLISFSIIGLWHGASWNFVIYGFMHGVILCYEMLSKKWRKKQSKRIPSWIVVFVSGFLTLSFFSFSLIFFRAENFHDAIEVCKRFLFLGDNFISFKSFGNFGALSFCIIAVTAFFMLWFEKKHLPSIYEKSNTFTFDVSFSIVLLSLIISLGEFNQQTFIYFQF